MNPEERQLLERSLKLAEDNNKMLIKMKGQARRAAVYRFIVIAVTILPLVLGYFLLQPYMGKFTANLDEYKALLSN